MEAETKSGLGSKLKKKYRWKSHRVVLLGHPEVSQLDLLDVGSFRNTQSRVVIRSGTKDKTFYGRKLRIFLISWCLLLSSLSSLVYCLWARPEAYPRVELLKWVGSCLTHKHYTILERLARIEHSS